MKKVRVFELAKDFGKRGPEMVKLLQDIGFDKVKTHMTVLDDADLMMIEARLSAQGLRRKPEGAAEAPAPRPKKSLTAAAEELEPMPEPAPTARKELVKKALPAARPATRRSLPRPEGDAGAAAELDAGPVAAPTAAPPAGPAALPTVPHQPIAAEAPAEAPAEPSREPPEPLQPPAAEVPAESLPVEPAAARHATPPAPPPPEIPDEAPAKDLGAVRRLLVPQKRATVVGRIELPQETVRDAKQRSAPAAPRDLRRQALQKINQRTGFRQVAQPGARRGPATRTSRDAGRSSAGPRKARPQTVVDPNKLVEVQEPVSMKALSEALGIKVTELIATLTFKLKIAGKNINSLLTNDEVELVGLELGRNIKVVEARAAMDELMDQLVEESETEDTAVRAPVVTFMGHVDHGKTSLMDALRQSDVARHESGGITQHIGAYKITDDQGRSIVVLDTPGHAAFTAMRARGAELTDIVVLVVAADDGVMPQTEEAINHANAAKVPIVVAITKCDLPGANPMQVKQQLMIKGLQAEEFGGQTGMVEVSAVKRTGLDTLIERILLEAEILDLRARPDAAGKGIVVESKQSPEQGVVVTLLVTDGKLRLKDQVVCGESFARVRAMIDDHGRSLTEAGPSTPITVFGLDRLPTPGDKLFVVEDAKKAREVVEERQRKMRELSRAERSAVTLETLSARLAERDIQEIKIVLKADAMGSLEPLRNCLEELSTPEVRVNLVHSGLGGINKADVDLAATSGAVIVGFNTVADANVRALAEEAGVQVRYYEVIYELLDQVKAAMEGLLAPEEVETIIGHAEVKATFKSSKFGTIAGCRVTDGIARRGVTVRLARDGRVVWSGKLASLRRISEDVREVKAGFECGMTLEGFQDIRVGDTLEFVQVELVRRTLGQ